MFGKLGLAIAALTMIGFSTPALASGPISWPTYDGTKSNKYVGVDSEGKYVSKDMVNKDGSFKAECVGCRWKKYDKNTDPEPKNGDARYKAEVSSVGNPASGKRTTTSDEGIKTSGEVYIKDTPVGKTLATHGEALDAHRAALIDHEGRISANEAHIKSLNQRVDEAYEGIAMAMAMDAPQVDPGHKFGISARWGTFEGANAFAGAFKYRINDNWAAVGGAGVGVEEGTFGATAGFEAQW